MSIPLVELTYTSFDSPAAQHGGWQVKDLRFESSLSATEREEYEHQLVSSIGTQLVPVVELPRFPSADDLAGAVRRLVYKPVGNDRVAFWHTVEAGIDGSGRPGNVFCHAVMFRKEELVTRSVDLWRSSAWITAHGPAHVAATTLGPAEWFGGGPEVVSSNSGDLMGILSECPTLPVGIALMGALLDATAAMLAGGKKLLLLTQSPDQAAGWLGLLLGWTSKEVANGISWSTFERADDLGNSLTEELDIVAVPFADRDRLVRVDRGRLVISLDDESHADSYGDQHEHWNFGGGDTLPKTEWSLMAMNAVAAGAGQDVLADLRTVVGEAELGSPERPSAALAKHLLKQRSPRLAFARRAAQDGFPLVQLAQRRNAGELEALQYVAAALRDGAWLGRDDGAPIPERKVPVAPEIEGAVRSLADSMMSGIVELQQRLSEGADPYSDEDFARGVEQSARRVRLTVDFLSRAYLLGEDPRSLELLSTVCGMLAPMADGGSDAAQQDLRSARRTLESDPGVRHPTDSRARAQPVGEVSLDPDRLGGTHCGSITSNSDGIGRPPSGAVPFGADPVSYREHQERSPETPIGIQRTRAIQRKPRHPDDWVSQVSDWGTIGFEVSESQTTAVEQMVRVLQLDQEPFFLAARDSQLRPHEELVALAVIASFMLSWPGTSLGKRSKKAQMKGTHLLQVARRLLDGGSGTRIRLAATVDSLVLELMRTERAIGASVGDLSSDESQYKRLLGQLAELDMSEGNRLKRLYQPELAGIGRGPLPDCRTKEYIARLLSLELRDHGTRGRKLRR